MSHTDTLPVPATLAHDRTKRLVDVLDPAIVAEQIAALKDQLVAAKHAKDRNRAKSIRRALRTRDCYLSREHAETAQPAESAPPAKKARAKKA